MDIHQLRVFSSVYRLRSFSRASEELNLSQPTVSMHIKHIEDELGVRLFDRVGRGVRPTAEADVLNTRAEELIAKLKALKDEIGHAEPSAPEGLLTIGAGSGPGAYIIPPLAAEFRKLHPKVFFQVVVKDTATLLKQVEDGALTLGVVDDHKMRKSLAYLHTTVDEMILVAAPGYMKKPTVTPLALFRLPLVLREEDSDARKSMERLHLMHRISLKALNVVAILGSSDAQKEAVKSGLGATIISRFAVKDDLAAARLEEIKIRGVHMTRNIYLIAPAGRTIPQPYQAFVEFIIQKLPSK